MMVSRSAWKKVSSPRPHSNDVSSCRREACGRWCVPRSVLRAWVLFLQVLSIVSSYGANNLDVRLGTPTLVLTNEGWLASSGSV